MNGVARSAIGAPALRAALVSMVMIRVGLVLPDRRVERCGTGRAAFVVERISTAAP
jgi:hypothetical protein